MKPFIARLHKAPCACDDCKRADEAAKILKEHPELGDVAQIMTYGRILKK